MENPPIDREIRYHVLQSPVLIPKLAQFPKLRDPRPPERFLQRWNVGTLTP